MPLLQPKLSLKVSQRQILTPGLVQMVSVLALNKLELRDMITAEMVENPVLEELEDAVPLLDDVGRKEEERERPPEESPTAAAEKKDPFEEIDFGSFFQEYLDPGYRSRGETEDIERPSFENFLSKPGNLTDHLLWQLGSVPTRPQVREAAELIIGNLNEDGYLLASDEELLGVAPTAAPESDAAVSENVVKEATALGIDSALQKPGEASAVANELHASGAGPGSAESAALAVPAIEAAAEPVPAPTEPAPAAPQPAFPVSFNAVDLHEALEAVRQFDPPGVACRDLRECLLYQLRFHQRQLHLHKNGDREASAQLLNDAVAVVSQHLRAVQNKHIKEISKALGRPVEAIEAAIHYIRTLDPRPGQRYNNVQPRLIEPDVAFVKHGDEWLVLMNDDDVPQLRLNPAYRRLLSKDSNDKETRNYV